MSVAERVLALQALLERVQRNAASPRASRHAALTGVAPPALRSTSATAAATRHVPVAPPISVPPPTPRGMAPSSPPVTRRIPDLVGLDSLDEDLSTSVGERPGELDGSVTRPLELDPTELFEDLARFDQPEPRAEMPGSVDEIDVDLTFEDEDTVVAGPDVLEEAERFAANLAAADAEAAVRSEAERGVAERAAAERASVEATRLAAARMAAEGERLAEELRLLEESRGVAARLAAEVAEAERVAREAAESARVAAEVAEAERVAREAAESARVAAEVAEVERVAREAAESARVAAEVAEAERVAREAAESARVAAEAEWDAAERAGQASRDVVDSPVEVRSEVAAADVADRSVTESTPPVSARVSRHRAVHRALGDDEVLTSLEDTDEPPESGEVESQRKPSASEPTTSHGEALDDWGDPVETRADAAYEDAARDASSRRSDGDGGAARVALQIEPPPAPPSSPPLHGAIAPLSITVSAEVVRRAAARSTGVAVFVGASRSDSSASFGDMLDASLALGSHGPGSM